jgi:hypothetical protein
MKAYMKIPDSAGFEQTVPFDAKESPLWYHAAGLQQTASGYGLQLTTRYMVKVRGKWRRVYCCQISNVGTCYIGKPGAWEYIVQSIDS